LTALGAPAGDWRAVDWASHRHELELDGAKLSYIDIGQGEPAVLFVHGLGAQWQVWLTALPSVADRMRAIAVDLPGFGRSEAASGAVSMRGYAELLERFCERLGLDRLIVVGNSMGGFIAAELALIAPRLVAGLVLIDAAGMVPTQFERARAIPFLHAMVLLGARVGAASRKIAARPGLRKAALNLVIHDPARLPADLTYKALLAPPGPSTRDALAASFSYLSHEWGEELRRIGCPTLIVWGEGDTLIPVRHAWEYAERIPHARVLTIPGAGHLPMIEQPERFDSALLEFLDEASGAA
jgi:pimeloyl-ACP methyl ester carboxylesterase